MHSLLKHTFGHIIIFMTFDDFIEAVVRQKDMFEPPLQFSEMVDIIEAFRNDYQNQEEVSLIPAFDFFRYKKFTTKKEFDNELKCVNKEIDIWFAKKRETLSDNSGREWFYDIQLEKWNTYKTKVKFHYTQFLLRKKLGKSSDISKRIALAKSVSCDNFVELNHSGYTCCVFRDHPDKTPSMKYYRENNSLHCFGCGKTADAIEVVKQKHGVNFLEAINIILGDGRK